MGDPVVTISGGLSAVGLLISLICFVLVLTSMFKHGRAGLAMVSVLAFPLAFVMGWIKSKDWRLRRTMSVWSACLAIAMVGGGIVARNLFADGLPSFNFTTVEPTESQQELNKKADEIELDIDV